MLIARYVSRGINSRAKIWPEQTKLLGAFSKIVKVQRSMTGSSINCTMARLVGLLISHLILILTKI
jgi:hypothetical protein